nr:hypothetical protein CFP56_44490 [Quercus suber]
MGLPRDQLKVGEVITTHDNYEIQMDLGHLVISFIAHSSWERGESSKAAASQSHTRVLSHQQCSSSQSKQLSKVIVSTGCLVFRLRLDLVGSSWEFTYSLMLLDRAILWTDSILYTIRELIGRMSVTESTAIGDSKESRALGLEVQTKKGNLELVKSSSILNLGSDLPRAEWARLGEVEESGKGSPMLCTPLNIVDPFLQDNATGILEIDKGRLEASRWRVKVTQNLRKS